MVNTTVTKVLKEFTWANNTLSRHVVWFCLFLIWFLPGQVFAGDVIREFASDIEVSADGTFMVTETIVYDFGEVEKHGIYRYLSTNHPQKATAWYKDRSIAYEILSVTRAGKPEPYQLTENLGSLTVRIGRADATVTGRQTYAITYRVTGGYLYYDNQPPELYWNATGHEWSVPMDAARVTVHDPDGIFGNQRVCYKGYPGEATSCDVSVATTSVTFSTGLMYAGEELTVAQSFSTSKVAVVIHEVVPRVYWLVPLLVLLAGAVINWLYRFKVHHRPDLPVVAQYEPYPEVLPMFTGVLMDGRLDGRDITAGLLYLAQEGFIKIKKIEKKVLYLFEVDDFEVELLKPTEEAPTRFHEQILSLLFKAPYNEVVALSSLRGDVKKQKENQKTLTKLREAIAEDVVERGFYEQVIKLSGLAVLIPFFALLLIYGSSIVGFIIGVIGINVFVPACAVFVFAITALVVLYRRRTRLGFEALNHLKGFKEFLSVTDKERFKFHNAPEKSPEQFMEYLPYAVALGVEKEWAEVFKDIVIESPDWYDGGADAGFSATALTTSLGAFSSSFSSSSGSSGSSGGGSAGGGAGGGGGGSW